MSIFSNPIKRALGLVLILTSILQFHTVQGQSEYQYFSEAGFKVKLFCQLRNNHTFLQASKQQGINNVLAAYIGVENENDPETGVIVNINIYDHSEDYRLVGQSGHKTYEKEFLAAYAKNLKNSGIEYKLLQYKGIDAVEYSFTQMGLPTKALVFLKDQKSYLLQVGTRKNLSTKYNYLLTFFAFYP